MYLRYKGIYYLFAFLLLVLGMYVNYYLLWILPFVFLYYWYLFDMTTVLYIVIVCTCLFFISKPSYFKENGTIEGTVEEVNEFHIILKSNRRKIKLSMDTSTIKVGERLKITYEVKEFNPQRNIGGFDQRKYYYGKRVFQQGNVLYYEKLQSSFSLTAKMEQYLDKNTNEKVNDYTKLLLFGIKEEEMQLLYARLTTLSIVHLMAISGMHFNLFHTLLEKILGFFLTEKSRDGISILILSLYAFVLRGNISGFRAYSMLLLKKLNKDYFNDLDLFSFIATVLLVINPYYIYNLSFVFSFTLYFFVLVLKKNKNSNFYLYMVSLPIICYYNFEINLTAIFLMYVIQPIIEIMYIGFIINSFCFFLFNPILHVIIIVFENLLSLLEAISVLVVIGKPSKLLIVVYYILLLCHLYLKEEGKKSVYIYGCFVIGLLLYAGPYYRSYGEITMIDVGQGDCFFIRLPYNAGNYLIDTGGSVDYDIATSNIIPYLKSQGIKKIDILFISHDDFDHSGARDSLVENFKVGRIVSDHDFELNNKDVTITSLNENHDSDANDNSLILHFDFGHFTGLFTGDISEEVEDALVREYPNLTVDILKISHHGSKTSSSSLFLSALNPSIALVSVGEHNLYHHPNLEVIERLKAYGMSIYRSDEDGMVRLLFTEDGFLVKKRLN